MFRLGGLAGAYGVGTLGFHDIFLLFFDFVLCTDRKGGNLDKHQLSGVLTRNFRRDDDFDLMSSGEGLRRNRPMSEMRTCGP